MNSAIQIIGAGRDTIIRAGGFFDWANGMSDQMFVTLNGLSVVISLGIVIFATIRGKGRISSILGGLLAGGLFAWAALSGVTWMRDTAAATVTSQHEIFDVQQHEIFDV